MRPVVPSTPAPFADQAVTGRTGPVPLRAGPLSLRLVDGDLRRICWGEREVVRRLHGAVRDRNWTTVPAEISDLSVEVSDFGFRVGYTSTHRAADLNFVWRARIVGERDGTIRFRFEGEARSTFLRNRIGLCLLHPLRECAGARCRTVHEDGSTRERHFPELVAAEQPIPGFTDLAGLAHEVAPGVWLEASFTGDLFETEDQRNWIDASFKTYSTPLRRPFPVEVRAGTGVLQEIVLRLRGAPQVPAPVLSAPRDPVPVQIRQVPAGERPLPHIGLGMASHGRALDRLAVERLADLRLTHLRADLRLENKSWSQALRTAARDAATLGCGLELAIHLPRLGPGHLTEVAAELARLGTDPARALVFRDGQRSTLASDLAEARAAFPETRMAVGAGTDADLYQLHLQPPPPGADFLCWSMNPQVHADDDLSLTESPEAVAHQLATLRRRQPGMPLVVSPVTLKPRFNPVATAGVPVDPDRLPPEVDARQATLLGAAWTLAVLQALCEGGASSVTLFETTGWRGVMETEEGSPQPERFPSLPGGVFPLYHVLADMAGFAGGTMVATVAEGPEGVASLLLRDRTRRRLLLANLAAESRTVAVAALGGEARLRLLDESSRRAAMAEPASFRAATVPVPPSGLRLPPWGLATLDFTAG